METNLDDVLQISNVFVNVSKGEVAKSQDLQKAFGTVERDDVVKEVCDSAFVVLIVLTPHIPPDPEERRGASWREGARTRLVCPAP